MATAVTLGKQVGVEEKKAVEPTQQATVLAGVGSVPSSIESLVAVKKEGYLETTISSVFLGTNKLIFQFPMIWTANGFGFEVQEFDVIKASDWPKGQKITIQHDEQTKEDGTQLCSNGKQQVRVKHTLTVRQ
jgi:hypothetical protein